MYCTQGDPVYVLLFMRCCTNLDCAWRLAIAHLQLLCAPTITMDLNEKPVYLERDKFEFRCKTITIIEDQNKQKKVTHQI